MSNPTISAPRFTPTPPERGSFPLDRQGQCKPLAQAYLECIRAHKSDAEACRDISKAYLQCRMEHNLMAPEEWQNLGFQERSEEPRVPHLSHARDGTPTSSSLASSSGATTNK